jgi:hypothetical protein
MRVMSLTEHFHDNIRRKDTLRHVSANIRQVPWLIIDIRYRLIWARYEENFNPSDDHVPIVFKFSEEAAQIVPTVNLPVLQEHDAVAGFRVRVQSFVSRDVEPIESCWHFSLLNFPQTLSCGYRTGKRGFALPFANVKTLFELRLQNGKLLHQPSKFRAFDFGYFLGVIVGGTNVP